MTLRIAILGITGRLGRAIAQAAHEDGRVVLTGGIVRSDYEGDSFDIGDIAGIGPMGVSACVGIEEGCSNADILIDASAPEAGIAAAERLAKQSGVALVTGVTGFDADQKPKLATASKSIPILAARNFSLGVALLESLTRQASAALPKAGWDAEISETHHRHKIDAPSGTALALGEAVAGGRGQNLASVSVVARSGQRAPGAIGFSCSRGGGVIGEHAVRFLSDLEDITLSHKAHDRSVFAKGAIEAALWLHGKAPGLYAMSDVMG